MIGLAAFWLEDIQPLRWIIDKFVMVLGGAFVPVAFFPEFLKAMAIYSPFGASQMITHTVYATWAQDYLKLICSQIIWIIILGIAVHYLSQKAYKSVSVNGG